MDNGGVSPGKIYKQPIATHILGRYINKSNKQ